MGDEHALRTTILEAVARESGLQPLDVRIFQGEYDRNIRITDPARGTWLIKVSDERIPAVALDWQETVLAAAAGGSDPAAGPGCETPHLLPTASGALRIQVVHGGETYRVRILSWIAGDLLSTRTEVPRDVHLALGRVSARLTAAFAHLEPPLDLPEHAWLAQRSNREIRAALDRLPQDSRTRTIAEVVADFEHHHSRRMDRVPWGVVHHDLHDDNVVVGGSDPMAVVGIIDFNDAHAAPLWMHCWVKAVVRAGEARHSAPRERPGSCPA